MSITPGTLLRVPGVIATALRLGSTDLTGQSLDINGCDHCVRFWTFEIRCCLTFDVCDGKSNRKDGCDRVCLFVVSRN
jgi:hypothetical protein